MVEGWSIRAALAWLCVVTSFAGASVAVAADTGKTVLVFGAASLTDVLDELGAAFTAQAQVQVKSSLAASSVLAKQIEAGAPADVFFSADLEWMDYLQQRDLLRPGSRHDVVLNRLVLIAPADSKLSLKIAPGFGPGRKICAHRPGEARSVG